MHEKLRAAPRGSSHAKIKIKTTLSSVLKRKEIRRADSELSIFDCKFIVSGCSLFLSSGGSSTCNRTTSWRSFLYFFIVFVFKIINLGMDDACSEYRSHLSQLAQIRGELLCHFLLLHAPLLRCPALNPDMFAPQLHFCAFR